LLQLYLDLRHQITQLSGCTSQVVLCTAQIIFSVWERISPAVVFSSIISEIEVNASMPLRCLRHTVRDKNGFQLEVSPVILFRKYINFFT
jgi:hypothetical protein